jgi:hypothetical protein
MCGVLVQGALIPVIIPKYLNDEKATLVGLALSCVQLFGYGFAPSLWTFYVVLIIAAPGLYVYISTYIRVYKCMDVCI